MSKSSLEARRKEKQWQHKFEYIGLNVLIGICALLPWSLLYRFAKFCGNLIAKKLQRSEDFMDANLAKCFPDLSTEDTVKLKKDFIINMTYIGFETLKLYSLSKKAQEKVLAKKASITNPEYLADILSKHPGCILWMPHYGNWEWLTSLLTNAFPGQISSVYKTLHNKYVDEYMYHARKSAQHPESRLEKIDSFVKSFVKDLRSPANKSKAYLMISDQRPVGNQEKVVVKLLGREVNFLGGPEKLARQKNLPIVYVNVEMGEGRNFKVTFEEVTYSIKEGFGEPTRKIAKLLEKQIAKAPCHWNWGHNLWHGLE